MEKYQITIFVSFKVTYDDLESNVDVGSLVVNVVNNFPSAFIPNPANIPAGHAKFILSRKKII